MQMGNGASQNTENGIADFQRRRKEERAEILLEGKRGKGGS
jgi:hypothetical protein